MREKSRGTVSARWPSARTLLRFASVANSLYLVCAVAAAVLVFVGVGAYALSAARWVLLSGLGVVLILWAAFAISLQVEISRGYTTLDRRLRHLPQVRPRDGRVVREAGEPFSDIKKES